jgi:Calcineurin-like phosphoesterase
MTDFIKRRDFLKLTAAGGSAIYISGLAGCATMANGKATTTAGKEAYADSEFYFVQLSDTHWGYKGEANPDAANTLKKAVAAVNALPEQPDFIMFTGDLTHTTDDPAERRKRLGEFREIVKELKVKTVRFMPGEHDGSLDRSEAFKEFFGETHYTFEHKGVHFIVLDNVSDPAAAIGDEQLQWLEADLKKQAKDAKIVVFTHRPLFDLAPKWDWATRDGAKAVDLLMPHPNVTVFYGHIHQEHHHMTGHIAHHSAKSLIFPLPVPNSQPKRTPLAWDAAQPNKGLGYRQVEAEVKTAQYKIIEMPVQKG